MTTDFDRSLAGHWNKIDKGYYHYWIFNCPNCQKAYRPGSMVSGFQCSHCRHWITVTPLPIRERQLEARGEDF